MWAGHARPLRNRALNHPPRAARTLSSIDAYALWSATYPPHAHNQLMHIEQAAMERLMPPLEDRTVLDLACGTGRYGVLARQAGARSVVSVDNSRAMLRTGNVQPAAEAAMPGLPFASNVFDVVICGLAAGHLPPAAMRGALAEIGRVLRPGGEALLSDFHPFLSLRGGQRTFSAPDGALYAVEHYPHLTSDYFGAIQAAGLRITAMDEPRINVDGIDIPAVFVVRCQR